MKLLFPQDVFTFCPRCGSEHFFLQKNFRTCRDCHLEYYVNSKPSVAVLLYNDNNEVLLVVRGNEPGKGFYDLPGGFVDPGETLEIAAVREIQEELGLAIESMTYVTSAAGQYIYTGVNYYTTECIFSAQVSSGTQLVAADDVASYAWFKKEDIPWEQFAFTSIKVALEQLFL